MFAANLHQIALKILIGMLPQAFASVWSNALAPLTNTSIKRHASVSVNKMSLALIKVVKITTGAQQNANVNVSHIQSSAHRLLSPTQFGILLNVNVNALKKIWPGAKTTAILFQIPNPCTLMKILAHALS